LKAIRTRSKPSTAKCNLDTYTLFLLAEPKYGGCNRLSEILGDVSHDSINRFLLRERYQPKDVFDEIKHHIEEVIAWGLKPKIVTGDTWYSSQENLKFLRNKKLGFLMGIAKNRKVSVQPGVYNQVQEF
jgi:hypothetical protein